MIQLLFGGVSKIHDVSLGPAQGFRVAGNFIRELPSGDVVASYHNHQWQVGSSHFSRYDCTQPTLIHLEAADGTRTAVFGPFNKLFVADGTLYADEDLFAKFIDETLNWHSYRLETYWPTLVIAAVSPESRHA
jgi:hypothetical protein